MMMRNQTYSFHGSYIDIIYTVSLCLPIRVWAHESPLVMISCSIRIIWVDLARVINGAAFS